MIRHQETIVLFNEQQGSNQLENLVSFSSLYCYCMSILEA